MNELVVAELDGFLNRTCSFGVPLVKVSKLITGSSARAVPRLRTGAVLAATTMILTVCSSHSEGAPLSVTRIVAEFVLVPAGGVQVNVPVLELIVAPAGADVRLKVRVSPGRSSSSAEASKVT